MKNIAKKFYESATFSIIITAFLSEIVVGVLATIIKSVGIKLLPKTDFWKFCMMYGSFIAYWIVFVLAMLRVKRNRPFLQKLGQKSGNSLKMTLIGALIGFATNATCILAATLTEKIFLSPSSQWTVAGLAFIFLCVMIQSGAEELTYRLFLYQRIKLKYPSGIPSLIFSSALFAAAHLGNPGIGVLPLLDLFVSGLAMGLFVFYFDAFWASVMYHTLWNYTQSIIFGLPNSGLVSIYSLFKLNSSVDGISFAYNSDFGVEGTVLAVLSQVAACVILIIVGEKKRKREREEMPASQAETPTETDSTSES